MGSNSTPATDVFQVLLQERNQIVAVRLTPIFRVNSYAPIRPDFSDPATASRRDHNAGLFFCHREAHLSRCEEWAAIVVSPAINPRSVRLGLGPGQNGMTATPSGSCSGGWSCPVSVDTWWLVRVCLFVVSLS